MTITDDKTIERDADLWSLRTHTSYEASLDQMRSPLTQGIVGRRISAQRVLDAREEAEDVVARVWSSLGYPDDVRRLTSNLRRTGNDRLFTEVVLVTEFLKMFTYPTARDAARDDEVTHQDVTYLRECAEHFFDRLGLYIYVPRELLVWSATTARMYVTNDAAIRVPEERYEYVWSLAAEGSSAQIRAHHHRPPRMTKLIEAVASVSGRGVPDYMIAETEELATSPLHRWLLDQVDRRDAVGDVARDYQESIRQSRRSSVTTADDLYWLPVSTGVIDEVLEKWEDQKDRYED